MDENSTAQIVGIAAGVCTAISLLPQIIKIVIEKKAGDISLFYLLVLSLGLALWTYYGILKNDIPIIATNAFSLLLNVIMIILGMMYKRSSSSV